MLILIIVIVCSLALFTPPSVSAASEYQLDYRSTYRVLPNQTVYVQHQIDLTNKLANIYPTSYTISIGTSNLENIQVKINRQPVKPEVSLGQNYTTISFPIPNPQIGLAKTNFIQITYFNSNILNSIGHNYEINLPKLSKANEAKTYLRQLIVPADFPNKVLITPKPTSQEQTSGHKIFTWANLPTKTINLLFGQYQVYQLNLHYKLQTPQTGKFTEIALPPDTPYQRVYLKSIEPEPQFIKVDQDGNWLANYQLNNQSDSEVKATLLVKVYPLPQLNLPEQANSNLTQPTNYWPSNQTLIKQLAQRLKTPFNIYDYLVNNFVYNHNRVKQNQRLGALKAIQNPQLAICTEFADSFIALVRSLHIPAREINGFAYTQNKQLKPLSLTQDVLHSWPEYFDPRQKKWLEIDPTWGNTTGGIDYFHKLDFNHIAFVRHGKEDNYPLPAGAYKTGKNNKTVFVSLAKSFPQEKPSYQIKNNQIINTGHLAIINQTLKLPNRQNVTVTYLPPYGRLSFQTKLSPLPKSAQLIPWSIYFFLVLATLAIIVFGFKKYLSRR